MGALVNNLYICTDHDGYWPVGTASIVLAETKKKARKLLDAELVERGLKPHSEHKYKLKWVAVDGSSRAIVLDDGDY